MPRSMVPVPIPQREPLLNSHLRLQRLELALLQLLDAAAQHGKVRDHSSQFLHVLQQTVLRLCGQVRGS